MTDTYKPLPAAKVKELEDVFKLSTENHFVRVFFNERGLLDFEKSEGCEHEVAQYMLALKAMYMHLEANNIKLQSLINEAEDE